MILQALAEYYQRCAALADSGIAPFGFSQEKLSFVLVMDEGGVLVQVEDVREDRRSKKIPVQCLLPQAVKRSSGIAANLLWDNAVYVLGFDSKGNVERTEKQHHAFVKRITDELMPVCDDAGLRAVARWLAQPSLVRLQALILG